jgi:U5 small nuclear ribonucleoprotein component
MASFEDYDEFGNYIGADLESDEEADEIPQKQYQTGTPTVPLEGFDDETIEPMAVMEVDGMFLPLIWHGLTNIV